VCNWTAGDNHWHNWGGIWQSVDVLLVPDVSVADIFAQPHWREGAVTAHIRIRNATGEPIKGRLTVRVAPDRDGSTVAEEPLEMTIMPGSIEHAVRLRIPDAREWSPDDPYLYRMEVQCRAGAVRDESAVRFGLREFTIADGYFRLNGRRFFPRCALQGGLYPGGICRPLDPGLLHRELLCVRQAGFNMMRALGYTPPPSQLDLADQIGVLIYQETPASWLMEPSPEGPQRWKANVREMILRDRNHPSVVMWGLLNESVWWDKSGEFFQYAADSLPELRSMDPSRMIVLDSGRLVSILDSPPSVRPDVGEYALPGAVEWMKGVADVHFYYTWPMADEEVRTSQVARRTYRGVEVGGRKVFYSEFGFGCPMDPFVALRKFEEWGTPKDNDDVRIFRGMAEGFLRDWERLRMREVFPTPSHLIRAGQDVHARKVTDLWRYVQANPAQIGTSYTGFIDESGNGEGVFTYWRDAKPAVEAIRKAQKPLRWSLFVDRPNLYQGDRFHLEAVLRNEDVLSPGAYPARLLIDGSEGTVWQKEFDVAIPPFGNGKEETEQVVFPGWDEVIATDFPQGAYEAHVVLLRGGDAWASERFQVVAPDSLPEVSVRVMGLGLPEHVEDWLGTHGVEVLNFDPAAQHLPVLVHDVIHLPDAEKQLRQALDFAHSGGTTVCLEMIGASRGIGASGTANNLIGAPALPQYHQKLEELLRLLPGAGDARISWDSRHWFISTEHYIRRHPVFDGLPTRCLLADGTYEIVYPLHTILGLEGWNEITGAFCLGALGGQSGYWHATDLATIDHGSGRIILSTYRLVGPLSDAAQSGSLGIIGS